MSENPGHNISGEERLEAEGVDKNRRRLTCALGAFILSLPLGVFGIGKSCAGEFRAGKYENLEENPARIYLGEWTGDSLGDYIRLSKSTGNPDEWAHEEIEIPEMGVARLILPIDIPQLSYARRGGIYQLNEYHALILYCLTCRKDIVLGLKKEGEQMKIGLHDSHMNSLDAQMLTGHTARHLTYNPQKWISYNPVK